MKRPPYAPGCASIQFHRVASSRHPPSGIQCFQTARHEEISYHQAKESWNIFPEGADPQYGESDKVVGKKIRASQFPRGIYFHRDARSHYPRPIRLGKFASGLLIPRQGREIAGMYHLLREYFGQWHKNE